MNNKQPTYSKQIIEIADYLYKHPDKKVQSVVALFCIKLHKSIRTIKTYIKQAKEYNATRLKKTEKAKDEVLVSEAKKEAETALKSRNEYLAELQKDFERLGEIKAGQAFKAINTTTGEFIGNVQAQWHEEINAKKSRALIVEKISKMEGWEAPQKTAQTDSKGNDIPAQPIINIMQYKSDIPVRESLDDE